jgi:hypothetical protein
MEGGPLHRLGIDARTAKVMARGAVMVLRLRLIISGGDYIAALAGLDLKVSAASRYASVINS